MVLLDQIEKLIEQCVARSCQRTPERGSRVETFHSNEEIPEIRRDLFTSNEMSHHIEGARDTKTLLAGETRNSRSQELPTLRISRGGPGRKRSDAVPRPRRVSRSNSRYTLRQRGFFVCRRSSPEAKYCSSNNAAAR